MSRWMTLVLLLALVPARALGQEPAPALSEARIEAALARYRHEPRVEDVVRAALQHRAEAPARARDAIDRARLRGLLPTVRGGLRRGQAIDLRGLTGNDPDNISTDDDLMLEARVVFDLDRLVFASEEVSLLRELRALETAQLELVRTLIALYFERRRLQLERDLLGAADLARTVRILEAEALLDVLTDGAFTRMLRAARRDG